MNVGQKVVCINDDFPTWVRDFYVSLPKKDQIYIIRDVVVGDSIDGGDVGQVCLYLVGMHNPIDHTHMERGFKSSRFAPLQDLPPEQLVEERELVLV